MREVDLWLASALQFKHRKVFLFYRFYIPRAALGSRWASKVLSIKSFIHTLLPSSKHVLFSLIKLVLYQAADGRTVP